MKSRIVYTVIREDEDVATAAEAIENAGGIIDEVGEYLYGGSGAEEKIGVEIQVSTDGVAWQTVQSSSPR